MVEFTVPWEERTEEFHESKKAKYQDQPTHEGKAAGKQRYS